MADEANEFPTPYLKVDVFESRIELSVVGIRVPDLVEVIVTKHGNPDNQKTGARIPECLEPGTSIIRPS